MAQFVFPKVEPADIQRSRRDLSLYKVFNTTTGVLVPILNIDMLPADWMRINTIATVQTLPMVAPVRGRWKCSFDYYYNPWSNIYGFMDNNTKLGTQSIIENKRFVKTIGKQQTQVTFAVASQGPKVPIGGLLDFLGCPIGYFGECVKNTNGTFSTNGLQIPAEGIITYLDIVRNYYVNNQETLTRYIRSSDYGGADVYSYAEYSLNDLDAAMMELRYRSRNGMASNINISSISQLTAYNNSLLGATESGSYTGNVFNPKYLCGLFLRTYRMDLLRGIMNTSVGSLVGKAQVVDNYVTMDQIFFANKLQTLINRIDITGGRFSDWVRTRWNIDPSIETDRPYYLGSHSVWLNTIDVVATASGNSEVASQRNDKSVLGQQVGYQVGKMSSNKQRPITIKSKQYGTLMCIFSIVPDVVYSQGFELNMLKTKFMDIYDPAFKQIGYQDALRGEYRALPFYLGIEALNQSNPPTIEYTNNTLTTPVGKRIAWSEYMASLNRSHSEFAYGMPLDFWVNNRTFSNGKQAGGAIDDTSSTSTVQYWNEANLFKPLLNDHDYSTYIYPHMWNGAFSDTSLTALNYIVDVYFQIDANRSLGKRLMPHL